VSPAGDERHYVRAVERAWSELLGRPAVVSPREFEAIDGWRRRGIPLAVVLEVIADFGKRRTRHPPKALTALTRAVNETWSAVAAGRAGPVAADTRPERSDALHAWEQVLGRCREGDPLRALLARLLDDATRGESGPILDDRLDASLPGAVPGELLASATARTEQALADFRRRMSAGEFRNTFVRALADRLRETLGLPRLALTRLGPSRQPTPPRLE
jgi:hypothetical protein